MSFAKASMQAKDLGKLPHCHESSNGSSVQIAEHPVAHEIPRKHLAQKHRRRRRRMLLRLLFKLFWFLYIRSRHDDSD
jgi:hypothetical protein